MTPTQRRTYSRKYQALQKALEKKYLQAVYNALNRQVKAYAALVKEGKDISTHLINEHISPVIRRLYLEAGLVGARKARAEIQALPLVKTKAASFGTNEDMVNAIIDYLQRFLLSKSVVSISETTKEWVMGQMEKGIQEGRGAYEIAKGLIGHQYLQYQALRVVRTETVRAANVGVKVAMDASPYEVQKEWISAHDKRTRHSHRDLDGVVRDVDEDFKPGLAQPGDPRAGASEVINCRCTMATVPKRDSQGRLIRKPVQMNPIPTTTVRQFLQAS